MPFFFFGQQSFIRQPQKANKTRTIEPKTKEKQKEKKNRATTNRFQSNYKNLLQHLVFGKRFYK